MNYNQVKSKKKNKLIIIVSLVLSLVLAGGAIAGIGYAFNWFPGWGAEVNEGNADTAKEFPTSSSNLNVSSINDIIGVEFSAEDFSIYYPYKDGNDEIAYYYLNLNVAGYGVDFDMPESGVYNIKFKINDQLFDVNSRFKAELEEGDDFSMSINVLKNGTVLSSTPDSHIGYMFAMGPYACPSIDMAVEGFSIIFYDFTVDNVQTFELVAFEKIAD